MAVYSYRAMNARGHVVSGRMDAINLVDLEMRLKRMDLDFVNGQPDKGSMLAFGGQVSRPELINFCFHLEQLARSGVPILESLTDLRDTLAERRFREIVAGLIESIDGGKTLSEAMSEHPRVFGQVFCSLIRAGENSGNLPEVLKSLCESLKWEDELVAQTKKLLMYPAMVGTVVFGVIVFLFVYLVPQMTQFIRNMGQTLPLQTRIMIAISDVMRGYWYLVLGLPLLAGIATAIRVRVDRNARYRWDAFKLALPGIGPILRKIILTRFASVFAMLYRSGIPVLDAVRATEDVAGNAVIRDGLQRAGQLIGEGQNVTSAFQNTGLFPPLVIRMLRVGESTGGLDTAMLNVAYFYDRDVKESISRIQPVIEVGLTLLLGVAMLSVMLAVLGPIYDVITKFKF